MPFTQPPSEWDGQPRIVGLPAGERLWRMHDRHLGSCTFSPPYDGNGSGGGRFDSTTHDLFPTLYAALSAEAAAAEYLAHSVSLGTAGHRSLPPTAITNHSISRLKSTRPLQFIALLTLSDLHRVGQDNWLVTSDTCDYTATREWARWLRAMAPEAHGVMWPSALFPGSRLMVLFGDRTPANAVEPDEPSIELNTAEGATWLSTVLQSLEIGLSASAASQRATDGNGSDFPATLKMGKPAGSSLSDYCVFYKTHFHVVHDAVRKAVLDRELASDATQEAMLITFRNWNKVARHPNPAGYVITTAKRIAVAVRVTEATRNLSCTLNVNPEYGHDSFTLDQIGRADDRLTLEHAVHQISTGKAEVLLLRDYYGYTEQETAHLLDIPAGTVKSRLHKARHELRVLLRGSFGEVGKFR